MRAEAEQLSEVERAITKEEICVLEEAVRVSAKWKAWAETMRVKRERQVEAERLDAHEEAAQMEAEIRSAAMKPPSSLVSDCV